MNATEINLLLVEDSRLDARLIEERLRLASPGSVLVRHAMTLAEGLGQVAAHRPDCILLDLHLPDGVGVENVEAMLEAADGTTLVVMTGLNDESTAIAALKLGAQEYLLKDQYDGPSLMRVLRHAIERNRLVRELDAQREEQYFHASHDVLTGLANRQLFDEQATQAVRSASRGAHEMAFCYIDLDGFKPVNDLHGHAVGDAALIQVAKVLQAVVRDSDHVARLGGDEFAVILADFGPGESARERANRVADRIINQIAAIEQVSGEPVQIGASVGISVFPGHGRSVEKLIVNADMAMYAAKRTGRGRVVIYSDQMRGLPGSAADDDVLDLERAITSQEFAPYFQPIFASDGRRLEGVEALIRWRGDEACGQQSTKELIDVARRERVLDRIETQMITLAIRQFSQWDRDGIAPGFLALNISAQSLSNERIITTLRRAIDVEGLPGHRLCVEIEPVSQSDLAAVALATRSLREWGVHATLQLWDADISIAELASYQTGTVKLRRPLVEALLADSEDSRRRVAEAVIAVATTLGRAVDLCGIESDDEAQALIGRGFTRLQGNWRQAAVSAPQFRLWLEKDGSHVSLSHPD